MTKLHRNDEGYLTILWDTPDGAPPAGTVKVVPDLLQQLVKKYNDGVRAFGIRAVEEGQSNLVDHARRELKILGEDQQTIDGLVRVVKAFADMGHSGGSASIVIPMINKLLQFQNLTLLTDDPEEWNHIAAEVWGQENGVWQSRRNPEAFSDDGGKTYHILSEAQQGIGKVIHTSEKKEG